MSRTNLKRVEESVEKADSRIRLSEIGYSGLLLFDGVTMDEMRKELRFPNSIKTYKMMSYHPAISAPFALYRNLISKATWRIVPPEKATKEELEQTKFVQECLDDMEHSFKDFINDALSANIYGFSVHEKVFRRRLKSKGSLYDDGKIGLKKLALRNQETIEKFVFDEEGNEVIGVKQSLTSLKDIYGRYTSGKLQTDIFIPREKFMLITVGNNRNDPYGKSPLRDVYMAWRYLTIIEEIEASGIAKDLQGLPVLYIPAQYMAPDASPEQKLIYESYKNIIRNIQNNSQSGLILPSNVDPETRQKLFEIELLSTEGKKNFDTNEVKQYYLNLIYTGLFADILVLGNNGVGSFALGQVKNSLTGAAVETILDNIVESFNRQVIRQLYELNGFDPARACKLDYDGINQTDLETLSKFIQRVASVGLVEKDRATLNVIRDAMGTDVKPEDEPVDESILTGHTSRASDGMAKGSGNGTSDFVAGTDTSSLNAENAA